MSHPPACERCSRALADHYAWRSPALDPVGAWRDGASPRPRRTHGRLCVACQVEYRSRAALPGWAGAAIVAASLFALATGVLASAITGLAWPSLAGGAAALSIFAGGPLVGLARSHLILARFLAERPRPGAPG